ncbi:sulfite exporter TauE/SafE family protein [Ornithinimicrobium cryptoxanthini]|uniref:Probable membrane transporter protein n=1 Tax=Ornithinimicrobium cryptoxanthini TaxID=2934161 RepID=A0ABY4YFN0_9MICO|nr:sulfite exporter TauE/SafE family protein [Ornithinimicrobium cryptoxanthini]USQ75533.1 sulfite exporter TauE/SafE family protein [Ornithinimicrobium cryptoxanthini]
MLTLTLVATVLAFVVSASAGLGGSLVLVPAYALLLGTKEGVALAALMLAGNNVAKVIAYRRTVPWVAVLGVVVATVVGSFIGARALVHAPESVVAGAVIAVIVLTFLIELRGHHRILKIGAVVPALGSGLTSGFSGSSGPLKGIALRALRLDRMHLVGAASLVSLFGDATKVGVYANGGLLAGDQFRLALFAIPVMAGSTWLGRRINSRLGERGYTVLFWGVLSGYVVRLAFT